MSAVAIIIVSYNTREHLKNCVHSLHNPPPDVTVIDAKRNVGYASANNLGIRHTQE